MNIDNIQSFFCQISKILDLYNLSCIQELIANPPTKLSWKIKWKKLYNIFGHVYKLKELMFGKSSLRFVYNEDLKAGSIHKLWTSSYSTVSDVKKGIVKCRMLTGTYLLHKDKHKFSNGKVQADCVLCCIGDEDIVHMLTQCSALHDIRREQMQILKKTVVEYTCKTTWNRHFNNPESITKLIMDCTLFRTLFTSSRTMHQVVSVRL
jgi:hypothetical protein